MSGSIKDSDASPYKFFKRVVSDPNIQEHEPVITSWYTPDPNKWSDMCDDEEASTTDLMSVNQSAESPQVNDEPTQVNKMNSPARKKRTTWKTQHKRRHRKPVVNSLDDFISMLQSHKRPFIDFTIDKECMCESMSNGEVCMRRCGKVHIQRCTHGDKCRARSCTYMHAHNMATPEGAARFRETQEEYDARGY